MTPYRDYDWGKLQQSEKHKRHILPPSCKWLTGKSIETRESTALKQPIPVPFLF